LLISATSGSFLDEKLSIYQFENSDFSLLEFSYTFEQSEGGFMGLYPPQFSKIFEDGDNLEWFTLDLVQGRWNEKFTKHFNSFSSSQQLMGARDPHTNEELIAMPPGITLRLNPIDDTGRLLSQIDSIFAVSLIEN
jgi:hypothetical protein